MNNEEIPKKFLLNPNKGVEKYIPEKKVYSEKYNKKIWDKVFPKRKGIKYDKLQLTNIMSYSMAQPHIGESLLLLLKDVHNKYFSDTPINELIITETNGGVGGLTIHLLQQFDKINVVEIQSLQIDMIKNNIKVYKLNSKKKQINLYNSDYLDILYNLNQDIIISDPPWGGWDYFKKKTMKLGMNNINIIHVINELYRKNKFKVFILLAMKNYNFQEFITKMIMHKIIIKGIPNSKHFYIIILGKDLE